MKVLGWTALVTLLCLVAYLGAKATGQALAAGGSWDCIDTAAQSTATLTLVPDPALKLPCNYHGSRARFESVALLCPPGRNAVMIYLDPKGVPLHSCAAHNSYLRLRYANGIYTDDPYYTSPVTFPKHSHLKLHLIAHIGFRVLPVVAVAP